MTKKLFYYSDSEELGGAERYLLDLIKNIDRQKYKITFILPKSKSSSLITFALRDVNVHVLCRIELWIKMPAILRSAKPDIIHLNMHVPFSCYWAIIFSKLLKVPFIVTTVHSTVLPTSRFWPLKLVKSILSYFLLPFIDRFICVSNASKNEFQANYKISGDKISVIYNGIDPNDVIVYPTDKIKLFRKEFGISEKTFVVGTITRLVKDKGVDILLKAFAEFSKDCLDSICLICGDGSEMNKLKKLAKSLGIENKVIFAGYVENIWQYLSLMDVFVFPSLHETFGLSVLEAIAAGKIVIATNVGGIPEVLNDIDSSFLFPIGQVSELSQKIKIVWENLTVFTEKAKKNAEKIFKSFDKRNVYRKIEEIYDNAK